MHKDFERILFSTEEITRRVQELGEQITADYRDCGDRLVVLGILKGSVPFMSMLVSNIDLDIECEYLSVSTYEEGAQVTDGKVMIHEHPCHNFQGAKILVVEDIADTRHTVQKIHEFLFSKGASEVKFVTLLDKPSRKEIDIPIDYIGFEVGNYFIVGFGLDFRQKYRNLPYIGVLKEELYR